MMRSSDRRPQEDWFYPSHNFGALPPELADPNSSKIVILPVPYETTTTYRGGCRRGPEAVIEASVNMELYDEELGCEPCEIGVHTLSPLDVPDEAEEMIERVDAVATTFLEKGKFVTALGGEHTVSIGMIGAVRRIYAPLSVLFLDAHADFRQSYKGNRYNHACTARRINELCPIVQAGVRSLSKYEADALEENNISTFWASDLLRLERGEDCRDLIERLVAALSENVYVTLDVDVFDPSIMPAVGTPEPGGLQWAGILDILRAVTAARKLVGLDLVELAPIPGLVHPQFFAARLLQRIWGYAFKV